MKIVQEFFIEIWSLFITEGTISTSLGPFGKKSKGSFLLLSSRVKSRKFKDCRLIYMTFSLLHMIVHKYKHKFNMYFSVKCVEFACNRLAIKYNCDLNNELMFSPICFANFFQEIITNIR